MPINPTLTSIATSGWRARLKELMQQSVWNEPHRYNISELEQLFEQAKTEQDLFEQLQAKRLLARATFYQQGEWPALHHFEDALELAQRWDDTTILARVSISLAIIQERLGYLEDSLQLMLHAKQLAEQLDDPEVMFLVLNNLADGLRRSGDLQSALKTQQQALVLAQQSSPGRLPVARLSLIEIAFDMGLHDEVIRDATALLASDAAQQSSWWLPLLYHVYGSSLFALGNVRAAATLAAEGLSRFALYKGLNERQGAARLYLLLANALAQQWGPERARPYWHAALVQAQEVNDFPTQLEVRQALYHLEREQGDLHLALLHLETFTDLYQRLSEKSVRDKSYTLAAESRIRMLEREKEFQHARSEELAQTNRALRLTQTALWYQATYDPLTGLMGRHSFTAQLRQELSSLKPEIGEVLALAYVDLDHFKAVNDLHGHGVGDDLLREVGERLTHTMSQLNHSNYVAGRMGGDEFTVLLPNLSSAEQARELCAALQTALNQPYLIGGRPLEVGASVGFALAPRDGQDAEELQRNADLAMYSTKRDRLKGLTEFSPELQRAYYERLQLEQELRGAEERGELLLHYQGRFSLPQQQLVGFEALLRWQHPTQGLVLPSVFIGAAEESGLILPFGCWILAQACAQAVKWRFAERNLTMSVNVAVPQFEQADFVEQVRTILEQTGLPSRCLVLELTESVFLRDRHQARHHLSQLRKLGIQMALDDFGTGYSSLSMVRELDLEHLKIDQAFLRSLTSEAGGVQQKRDRALLETMVQMARSLDMKVTAEGVEDAAQLQALQEAGCDYAQGYYFSRPVAAFEAEKLLD